MYPRSLALLDVSGNFSPSEESDIDDVSEEVVMDKKNMPVIPKDLQETDKAAESKFAELDRVTLDILDDDSGLKTTGKFIFHPKLGGTWGNVQTGLKMERKAELLDKYPRKDD